jgi:hypothetical protein
LDATLRRVLHDQGPALLHARIDPHCAPTPQVARDEALDVMWSGPGFAISTSR